MYVRACSRIALYKDGMVTQLPDALERGQFPGDILTSYFPPHILPSVRVYSEGKLTGHFSSFFNDVARQSAASADAPPPATQVCDGITRVPKVWTHFKNYVFMTSARSRRTGAAARVERRQRERSVLLAVRGRRASRGDTRAKPGV